MNVDVTGESFRAGTWMKDEMKKREWNLFDLAYESGVPERTLSDYLRNIRSPKLETFAMICKAFGKKIFVTD